MREGSPPPLYQVSGVTSHISHITYHISLVMCHILIFFFFLGQSEEASQWRVCYQRVIPILVFFLRIKFFLLRIFNCLRNINTSIKLFHAVLVSRPGLSQGLLYKHLRCYLNYSFILFLPELYGAATPKQLEIALPVTK